MRLLYLSGHRPNLSECANCRKNLETIDARHVVFDVTRGAILCQGCISGSGGRLQLSKGTIKHLIWFESGDLKKASRVRFGTQALKESLTLLEAFVPYILGIQPKSLKFLKEIRK